MKAAIYDHALLASIRPIQVGTYLRAKGWHDQPGRGGQPSSVWTVGQDFEVDLPLSTNLRDYAVRIAELLKTLETVEGRSQLQIFEDIQKSSTDIIRIRIDDDHARDGTLPIDQAAALIIRSRDMLLAAACSEVFPRMYYPSRKPAVANEYINRVRMGQTERGSFVVTLLSPVAPQLGGDDDPNLEEPFERRATVRLARALSAMKQATQQAVADNTIASFSDAVLTGVSANLVDAVVGLSKETGEDNNVEIDFSWARSRRFVGDRVETVVVTPDSTEILEEVSRVFKARTPREEFELRGSVITLHRDDPQDKGEVTVYGLVDGELRKVKFDVAGDDYRVAIGAHESGAPIAALGVLSKEGRQFILRNPRAVQEIADDQPI